MLLIILSTFAQKKSPVKLLEFRIVGTVNEGVVDSRGLEFDMGYSKQLGQFNLSLNGNIIFTSDKVITQNGQNGIPDYQKTIGKIGGSSLIFLSDGIFEDQAQIAASPSQTFFGRIIPGDVKYKDVGSITGKPDGLIDNFDRVRVYRRDFPNIIVKKSSHCGGF